MKRNHQNPTSSLESSESQVRTVAGRNAVLELLASAHPVDKIYVQRGAAGSLKRILAIAAERKIPVSQADSSKLFTLAGGDFHQGVAALATQKEYVSLSRLFEIAEERGEAPFFLMADGVEDPHNLGALIRSCDGAGVHGVIIPKTGAVGMTATVMKSSAGAAEHMAICRVSNLAQTVDKLQEMGVWVYACEADGTPYNQVDWRGPVCVILGSEGFGISRLLKEKSDFIVSLPMKGKVNSLNVSCAGAVILYEAQKYR